MMSMRVSLRMIWSQHRPPLIMDNLVDGFHREFEKSSSTQWALIKMRRVSLQASHGWHLECVFMQTNPITKSMSKQIFQSFMLQIKSHHQRSSYANGAGHSALENHPKDVYVFWIFNKTCFLFNQFWAQPRSYNAPKSILKHPTATLLGIQWA